ncbi:hypothetical protein Asi02nite_01140 [Asanoa siamensis]|uniref:Uncharacterized protein n=1 Tax=Asanoa siamensis TaxID=926357 RepID=A0ABQ4CH24_9ACTN|nr:hypothetical protein Asi02nite_01140 [Asanoa siamensis]
MPLFSADGAARTQVAHCAPDGNVDPGGSVTNRAGPFSAGRVVDDVPVGGAAGSDQPPSASLQPVPVRPSAPPELAGDRSACAESVPARAMIAAVAATATIGQRCRLMRLLTPSDRMRGRFSRSTGQKDI